ncbi:MAG: hypothetical protein ABIJ21_08615 [Nanoarchaeota archaeon]
MQFDSIDSRVRTLEEERKLIEGSDFWKKHLAEHQREHTQARLVVLEEEKGVLKEARIEIEDNAYFEKPLHMGCACGKVAFKTDEKGSVQPYDPGEQKEYFKDKTYESRSRSGTYK